MKIQNWSIGLPDNLPVEHTYIGIRDYLLRHWFTNQFEEDQELCLWRIASDRIELVEWPNPEKICVVPMDQCHFNLSWDPTSEPRHIDEDSDGDRDDRNIFALIEGDFSQDLEIRGFKVVAGNNLLNGEPITICFCEEDSIIKAALELEIDSFYLIIMSGPWVHARRKALTSQNEAFYENISLGDLMGEGYSKKNRLTHYIDSELEGFIEASILDYVLTKADIGIYDPNISRRPKVPVLSFEVELLEVDDDNTVHAAGPVVLKNQDGEVVKYLRISVKINSWGQLDENSEIRAAFIEEINSETGACKETAAFSNC